MSKNRLKILPLIAAVLLIVAVLPVVAVSPAGADRRKSDYIFMEALRQNTLGNRDAYYTLLRRAAELDPDETSIGTDLGFYEIALFGQSDSAMLVDGIAKMKRHFDANPSDYYSSLSYGTIAVRLGMADESVRVWSALDSIFPDKVDVALNLAEVLGQTGDSANIRRSIAIFGRMERVLGPSLVLTGSKIRSYLALKDTVGATSEIKSFISASPNDVAALLTAGDLNMALQRPDSAIVYYNRACEVDSTSGPAFYKRASYYQEIGDSVKYDNEILEVLSKDNLDFDVKMELLRVYLTDVYSDSLRQPQVEALFGNLIDRHPHEVDLHKLYASYLVAIRDFSRAAEQQSYALDIDPSKETDWLGLMSLYASANEHGNQVEAGKNALRYFPENPDVNWYVSMALMADHQNDSALVLAKRAAELAYGVDSTNVKKLSSITCSIGDIYYSMGLPDSAFVYYEKSIGYDPNNLLALNNCAYYLACENKDLDRAEAMSARTVAEEPDNTTSLDTYAWVFFKKRDYVRAKEFIDKTIELEEEPSADVFHHAGDIYFMAGDPSAALDFWKKALKLDPDNELLIKKIKNRTYFYE